MKTDGKKAAEGRCDSEILELSRLNFCFRRQNVHTSDHLDTYCGTSRHIVVYHRGCIYKLDVFDENNCILGLEELIE